MEKKDYHTEGYDHYEKAARGLEEILYGEISDYQELQKALREGSLSPDEDTERALKSIAASISLLGRLIGHARKENREE